MRKLRFGLIVLCLLLGLANSAVAQLSIGIGIGLPNLSIGINLPSYPQLVSVPGYPVYYAPDVNGNYFYYDGMYWVYQNDNWYASSWYNGPWGFVEPDVVPLFILRIPVRYYRQPPAYFRGWQSNAPPRWGQHWGNGWEQRRSGWDKWNRKSVQSRAPLPTYQRQYTGDRYPHAEQQHSLHNQNYSYQPRDKAVRQHIEQQKEQQRAPAPSQLGPADQHAQPQHQTAPQQHTPAGQEQKQHPGGAEPQHEQQAPRVQGQEQKPHDRGESHDSNKGHGQGQNKDDEHGRDR